MSRILRSSIVLSVVVLFLASGMALALEFVLLESFPKAAPGAYGIVATGLPDGRLIVWNGDAIYLQSGAPTYLDGWVGEESFTPIASGYAGDPGFIALAPDGHTVLLGAGFSGTLYLFDVHDAEDYIPGSEIATIGHYSALFLTQDLVLIDKPKDDYSTDELAIVDLSAPTPAATSVMDKPAAVDLAPGEFAASAQLAVDAAKTTVYVMSQVYDAGFMLVSNQLKSVSVSDLIDAYYGKAVLDWNTDAVAIGADGAFNSAGPAATTSAGHLPIGGFGGVQLVNPSAAVVVDTYAPAGAFEYYAVAYDSYTDVVLPIVADPADWSMDVVYAPAGAFGSLPTLSAVGLLMLVLAVATAGLCALRVSKRGRWGIMQD